MGKQAAGPGSVTVSRIFKADPDHIFNAWTVPEMLERWWAPPGFKMNRAVIDLRNGGCFRISMIAPDSSQVFAVGMLEVVRRPEHLVFLWEWEGWDPGGVERTGVTRVAVEFRPRGRGTEVVLTQDGLVSDEIARGHARGWRECLERMAQLIDRSAEPLAP